MNIPKIPLGSWIDRLVDWITATFDGLFDFLTEVIEGTLAIFINVLNTGPSIFLILILTFLALYTSRWALGVFTLISLLLIQNLGYWDATVDTLALVLSSGLITILIGIPIGIWVSQSDTAKNIVTPILDFMQTMPAFVYLIPSILFFGIGIVPGIIASVIFAVAPTIRLTNLGIREVPQDLIEATEAFGSTTGQRLLKVQLPLAAPTILAGINQSIMLSLSMVVIASLVGAPGLGAEVYRAVTQIQVGQGFEAGLSIVMIAIILDRISQNLRKPAFSHIINPKIVFGVTGAAFLVMFAYFGFLEGNMDEQASADHAGAQVDYQITGIDPGSGLMKATEKAMEDYNLQDWTLREGSSAAMTAELKKAYENEEPIIITGWTPHWMFQKYDLKYLDDPKGSYGEGESIHTVVRKGLEEEAPGAYQILDQFYWKPGDMEEVMVEIQEGADPKTAAQNWIDSHSDVVQRWIEGTQQGNGQEIIIVYVAWESEIASTNVISEVLEQQGYNVNMKQVEAGPMFAGIADGSADAMVAAWLPTTHADYFTRYEDALVDLGANLEGTRLGLTVPEYMEIDSIDDLK
ncbi:glycine/betaine ABC transporter substrate-binding protein [Bacillus sp. V3-13]|uniref:glycine betaine ABC transporter substrate-binding protein n=1 Tax=Bacillus sp. V3-13 TaxID=2053728 RepID=UPI000C77D29F|nr:glycine betaine ABC transporter substrate-binding protein [Bacillus sp. V3-13]PLR76277.1 glycine/betaine ABC transporter substrate-binding protein [Bacillus sp. V3-13]